MKRILSLFVVFLSISAMAQENYQYVIVPKRFSFFNEDNKYNLNVVTKSFFESEGFTVFYDGDTFPEELATNRCFALFVDVTESNTLFLTNLVVTLKDCKNRVVYESLKGSSREKVYSKGYTAALRAALVSMKGKLVIKRNPAYQKQIEEKPAVSDVRPVKTVVKQEVSPNQLYAIPTDTGFKLVDSQPNTVMLIKRTSVENVFIAEKGTEKGVFIKKGDIWFFEYYVANQLVAEKVDVKF